MTTFRLALLPVCLAGSLTVACAQNATAIRHAPLNNSSRLTCVNNIVHSFQNTGSSQVRALFLTGGRSAVINNSVLVNDVTSTGTTYTVYNGLTSPDASLTPPAR